MQEKRIVAKIQVSPELAGKRIIDLLREEASLPNRQIRKVIATRGVLLNGKPVHSERRVKGGEELRAVLPAEEQIKLTPVSMKITVIYEDKWLLVVDKPSGISLHNTRPGQPPALANGVAHYFQSRGQVLTPRPVHRLDAETSGVVLFAKDATAQRRLTEVWSGGTVQKNYWALAEGKIETAGEVKTPIRGKKAWTHYEPTAHYDGYSEVFLKIHSGRTHQIRIHLAEINHPVLGDRRYNQGSGFKVNRLALHAVSLELMHPVTGETLRFEAPVPRRILVERRRH